MHPGRMLVSCLRQIEVWMQRPGCIVRPCGEIGLSVEAVRPRIHNATGSHNVLPTSSGGRQRKDPSRSATDHIKIRSSLLPVNPVGEKPSLPPASRPETGQPLLLFPRQSLDCVLCANAVARALTIVFPNHVDSFYLIRNRPRRTGMEKRRTAFQLPNQIPSHPHVISPAQSNSNISGSEYLP